MKFPSLKTLASSTETTIQRFPFEFLFAVIGTTAAIIHTETAYESYINKNWLIRVMLSANLGLLLSLATTLFTESKGITATTKFIYKTIAFLVAITFIFILDPRERPFDYYRFFLLSLSFHLLVSFAAYTRKDHIQGFWQFNKTLFLRFLASVLYSGVLFIGLAAAIAAANYLFNLKIDWHTYTNLWYIIAGIFNTLFFLTGIPPDTKALDNDVSYPKSLKVFTQYVLIPLASIYLIILLAYEVKILIQWNLPKGVVSNLILGYAVYGILSILLVYPIKEQEDNKWIKSYARSFYFLMLPLLVLLFLAMGKRISDYGITEDRYFLLLLGCWLLFITLYFLFSKKQNIKLIPVSLCIIALFTIYGPQSAFSVSTYSQKSLLINIFKKHSAYENGKLITLKGKKINKEDGNEAVEKLRYFVYNNKLTSLQSNFDIDLNKVIDSLDTEKSVGSYANRYDLNNRQFKWVKNHFGLSGFVIRGDYDDFFSRQHYEFSSENSNITSLAGYDYAIPQTNAYGYTSKSTIDNLIINENNNNNTHQLSINDESVSFNLSAFAENLVTPISKIKSYKKDSIGGLNFVVPERVLTISKQTSHYIISFKLNRMRFSYSPNEKAEIDDINGLYLIKRK